MFYPVYISNYLINRLPGDSDQQAYEGIVFEQTAQEFADGFVGDLQDNGYVGGFE